MGVIELARKVARERHIEDKLFVTILCRESRTTKTVAECVLSKNGADPEAVGDVDVPRPGCKSRGLFQVNSCYHPEVTDKCAFDAVCNISWAADRFREGRVELFTSWKLEQK